MPVHAVKKYQENVCEVTGAVRRPCWASHVECCGGAPHLLEPSLEPSPELGGSG